LSILEANNAMQNVAHLLSLKPPETNLASAPIEEFSALLVSSLLDELVSFGC
jgi:hypothetical protein